MAASPLAGQHAIGLGGVFSNQLSNSERQQNAFGVGLAYTRDLGRDLGLAVSVFGGELNVKVFGAIDYEVVAGELEPGACRWEDPITGEFNFYKDCVTRESIDFTVAEAEASTRWFGSLYLVVDWKGLRLGATPLTVHIWEGDWLWSGIVGYSMTPSSWIMLEKPNRGGFRIRIEASIWSNPA